MSETLYRPTRAEFTELAGEYPVVPVWREVLADLQTPVGVYDRLRDAEGPTFLLESVEHGERWGRYSFIGLRPFLTLTARSGTVWLEGAAPEPARQAAATGDPLGTLDALTEYLRAPQLAGLPPLFAGAVGYLGYDVVRFVEDLPDGTVDELGMDDVRLVFPGQLIAFDHLRQRLLVVSNVRVGDDPVSQYDEAITASERLVDALGEPQRARPAAPPVGTTVTDAEVNMPRASYLEAVERAKEHIRAGDVYQVVASQRFSLDTDVDPFAVYRVLRVINPSPYLYFFDYGDTQIVGSSPEALVTLVDGQASIWPIAGSRPRGDTEAQDVELANSLLADEKERSEHVMLVDLARNDLGRVCALGSVTVADFMEVVRYSHVMHLWSRVVGSVTDGTSAVDVLRAAFPAGTLTGAPKVRAMELIDGLEPTRRGLYGGGIGYVDLAGNLDVCIAIRTVVFIAGRAHVQAGAGIVADSEPEAEYAETEHKAMALLSAIRAAERLEREPAATVPDAAGGQR